MSTVQIACRQKEIPQKTEFLSWVEASQQAAGQAGEITVRIVDENEMGLLNLQFRGKEGPTNVLSFPFETSHEVEEEILGDIVICAQLVEQEAVEFQVSPQLRWAHMTVHGVLHLCGYLHNIDAEAKQMEQLESRILMELGFSDPYEG